MDIETARTLETLAANARQNNELSRAHARAWMLDRSAVRSAYLTTAAQINGRTVSCYFAVTGRANTRRSMNTAGAVRWQMDGKVIAYAALVATLS